MIQLKISVIESQEGLVSLPPHGGIYMWTIPNEQGVLEPYYIGQTQNFENRFIEEFGLFISGRWFCFDPDVLKSYTKLALAADGRDMEDPSLFKDTGLLFSSAFEDKSLFCHFTNEARLQTALKMLKQTKWVLLSASAKCSSLQLRSIEDQIITNYRKYILEQKKKMTGEQNNRVPQLIHKKTGRHKHFVGDWNGARSLQNMQSFKVQSTDLFKKSTFEVIKQILK